MELMSRSAVKGTVDISEVAVILDPADAVAIAKKPLMPGTMLRMADKTELRVSGMVPPGHKVALKALAVDDPIRRYGQIVGFATAPISPGQHVHVQNMSIKEQGSLTLDYAIGEDYVPRPSCPRPSGGPSWATAGGTVGSGRGTTSRCWPRSTARRRRPSRWSSTSGGRARSRTTRTSTA
jgi:hypothetical protein